MKVWEWCNKVKGTDATKEQIAKWSYMNRICPIEFEQGLELKEGKFPAQTAEIAQAICAASKCDAECLDKFLESEVPND